MGLSSTHGMQHPDGPMVSCDNTTCLTGKTLRSTRTLHGAMQLQYSWPQGKRVGVKSRRRAKGRGVGLQMIGTSVVVRGPPLVHCCSFCHSAPTCYWHCHSGLMIVSINGKGMMETGCARIPKTRIETCIPGGEAARNKNITSVDGQTRNMAKSAINQQYCRRTSILASST